jgi:hypothetical protein
VDDQLNRYQGLSGPRRVQLGVVCLECLPTERAERVCRRARADGLVKPTDLKNTVERRLALSALRNGVAAPAPHTPGLPPFARAIGELSLRHAEVQKDWQ